MLFKTMLSSVLIETIVPDVGTSPSPSTPQLPHHDQLPCEEILGWLPCDGGSRRQPKMILDEDSFPKGNGPMEAYDVQDEPHCDKNDDVFVSSPASNFPIVGRVDDGLIFALVPAAVTTTTITITITAQETKVLPTAASITNEVEVPIITEQTGLSTLLSRTTRRGPTSRFALVVLLTVLVTW